MILVYCWQRAELAQGYRNLALTADTLADAEEGCAEWIRLDREGKLERFTKYAQCYNPSAVGTYFHETYEVQYVTFDPAAEQQFTLIKEGMQIINSKTKAIEWEWAKP